MQFRDSKTGYLAKKGVVPLPPECPSDVLKFRHPELTRQRRLGGMDILGAGVPRHGGRQVGKAGGRRVALDPENSLDSPVWLRTSCCVVLRKSRLLL